MYNYVSDSIMTSTNIDNQNNETSYLKWGLWFACIYLSLILIVDIINMLISYNTVLHKFDIIINYLAFGVIVLEMTFLSRSAINQLTDYSPIWFGIVIPYYILGSLQWFIIGIIIAKLKSRWFSCKK